MGRRGLGREKATRGVPCGYCDSRPGGLGFGEVYRSWRALENAAVLFKTALA